MVQKSYYMDCLKIRLQLQLIFPLDSMNYLNSSNGLPDESDFLQHTIMTKKNCKNSKRNSFWNLVRI